MHADSLPSQEDPASLGYRWPAEWEPHAATWLSWPHNRATWPRQLEPVEAAFAQMVRALAPHEDVHINVQNAAHQKHVRQFLREHEAWASSVHLHRLPTDDAWIRDYGPLFVTRAGEDPLAATTWRFDSWGQKYPPWHRDDAAANRIARVLGVPSFGGGLVLEGGAIEGNGAGLVLASRASLLDPTRNPGVTEAGAEAWLRRFLGAETVVWLGAQLAGDDTDGHADTIARFATPDTVLVAAEKNPADTNHAPLQAARMQLEATTGANGHPLRTIPLPMPAPLRQKGQRLPASYANFYTANGVVLCPAYDDPADAEAQRVLARAFPERGIVPIPCRDVVWGLGAVHCLTQQVPETQEMASSSLRA